VIELTKQLLAEPWGLQLWVGWMMLLNTLSLAFWRRIEARWVLAAWAGNLVLMPTLCALNGYNRLLGLSHVLFWTPLLIYLLRRRRELPRSGAFGAWIHLLLVTDAASLVVDYIDVVRYLAGDRG